MDIFYALILMVLGGTGVAKSVRVINQGNEYRNWQERQQQSDVYGSAQYSGNAARDAVDGRGQKRIVTR